MTLTSYAQNFEDVILWRALKHVEKGLYIDVGAQHPVIDSVSLAFYEHGWRGVHVEPNPYYAQLLRESRSDETVIQAAVSDKGAVLRFYEIADTGLSTGDAEIAERHRASGFFVRETSVPCVTLANIFESCAGREIHWLKIDVEGLEEQVLQGWKPSMARPWIVVVESALPLSQLESNDKWEKLILDLDYQFVYFDGLNRYYLANRHSELKDAFRAGPNVFDGFVLSGTSSASFCSLLNTRLATREQELGAQLNRLQQTLDAVYNSRSWRLTRPLREVKLLVKKSKHYVTAAMSFLSTAPLRIARRGLRYVLEFVQAQPTIKMSAKKVLVHFPLIKARLKVFSHSNARMSIRGVSSHQTRSTSQIRSKAATLARGNSSCNGETDIRQELHRVIDGWRLGKRVDD